MKIARRHSSLAVCLAAYLVVGPSSGQILNSERIEQMFGSYGIEVLHADPDLRISNLFSFENNRRTTRTVAVVGYPGAVHPALADGHEAVLSGGSIGATFLAEGWEIVKGGNVYFLTHVPDAVVAGMGLSKSEALAAHAYRLTLAKDGRRFAYASIIEIHHPDYLSLEMLEAIYGPEAEADLSLDSPTNPPAEPSAEPPAEPPADPSTDLPADPLAVIVLLARGLQAFDRYSLTPAIR